MSTSTLAVSASDPRPSGYLPPDEQRIGDRGPLDVDVEVQLPACDGHDAKTISGTVTLVPDQQIGGRTYRPFGDTADTWVDGWFLRELRVRYGLAGDSLREVLALIRDAACVVAQ